MNTLADIARQRHAESLSQEEIEAISFYFFPGRCRPDNRR